MLSATNPGTGYNIMNIPDNSPALMKAVFLCGMEEMDEGREGKLMLL